MSTRLRNNILLSLFPSAIDRSGQTMDISKCQAQVRMRGIRLRHIFPIRRHGTDVYGIPQCYAVSKMSTVAPDWATDSFTQVTWGEGCISTWCGTSQPLLAKAGRDCLNGSVCHRKIYSNGH